MGGTTGCEAGVPPAGKDGTGHVKKSYRKLIIREVTQDVYKRQAKPSASAETTPGESAEAASAPVRTARPAQEKE